MNTVILAPTPQNLRLAASEIKNGGLVAFPTETVYGLGCSAYCERAARSVYEVKGRPSDNPLIVHFSEFAAAEEACRVNSAAKLLASRFMPGPLTVVLSKKESIPYAVTGGLETVAVRVPSHPVAREFLALTGGVAAPSANTSTKPSPTSAAHVLDDLGGKIPYIIDGGSSAVGIESTIIDCSQAKPRLLRRGGIPLEQIIDTIGEIEVVEHSSVALSPGMKYKHYAPVAEVYMCRSGARAAAEKFAELSDKGVHTLVMGVKDSGVSQIKFKDDAEYAHCYFDALRRADAEGYGAIICMAAEDGGIGASLNNRIIKSSGGKII